MKILGIKFLNLNSLKGEHEIRFDGPPFTDSGLFAITGPTGAGKTTILDAITIALYGSVHRHDRDDPSEIMTRHTGESYSEVEFEVKEKKYRAKWSNYRARKRSEGKLQGVRMELADAETGELIIDHPLNEVKDRIIHECGLDYNQFVRSVMLSQGDFTRFMKANENERSDLLEKITDTSIYSEISSWVYKKSKSENSLLEVMRTKLNDVVLLSGEELQAHHVHLQDIHEQEDQAKKERDQAIMLRLWMQRIDSLQARQSALQQQLHHFQQRYDENGPFFRQLELHRQATRHLPVYNETETSRKSIVETRRKLEVVNQQLPALEQSVANLQEQIKEADRLYREAEAVRNDTAPVILEAEKRDDAILRAAQQCTDDEAALGDAQAQLATQQENVQKRKQALQETLQKIRESEAWLTANASDAGLERMIPTVGNQLEKGAELNRRLQTLSADKNSLEQRLTQEQGRLQKLEEGRKELQNRISQAGDQLQQMKMQADSLLSGKTPEQYEAEMATLPALISLCEEQLRLARQARTAGQQRVQLAEKKAGLSAQTSQLEATLTLRLQELADGRELFDALQKNLELQILLQKYEADRNTLTEGEPCPLCGALHHPFTGTHPVHERSEAELKRDAQKRKTDQLARAAADQEVLLKETRRDLAYAAEQEQQHELAYGSALELFEANNLKLPRPLSPEKPEIIQLVIERKRGEQQQLAAAIQQMRLVDKQARQQEAALSRLTQQEIEAAGLLREAGVRLEGLGLSLSATQQELTTASAALNELKDQTEQQLRPFGLSAGQSNTAALMQQLRDRADGYAQRKQLLQELQVRSGSLETAMENAADNLEEKGAAFRRLDAQRFSNSRNLERLRQERIQLFGARDTVLEKKRLETDLQLRKATADKLRMKLTEEEQACKIAQSRQKDLTTEYDFQRDIWEDSQASLLARLEADGIASVEEFLQRLLPDAECSRIEELERKLTDEKTGLQQSLHDNEHELHREQEKSLVPEDPALLSARIDNLEFAITRYNREIGRIDEILKSDEQHKRQFSELAARIVAQQELCERWNKLSGIIGSENGKRFSRFAQGLTLARLTELANRHLLRLSDRYRILKSADRDLELQVIDSYQADVVRPMSTLSGGESFLVSLALALGLSDLASRKVQINSLFIDEGFGTLDAETLDTAITALENLQANGKTIGIISHVEALKERISTQIQLSKQPGGSSRIRITGYGL